MGLDSIDLIHRFEKEFGIAIPDEDAERVHRVGEVYELILSLLQPKVWRNYIKSGKCISQNLFYQFRQILVEERFFPKEKLKPSTSIDEITNSLEKQSQWKVVQNRLGIELPYFVNRTTTETIKDLILHLQVAIRKRLQYIFLTEKELYHAYKEIIVDQIGVEMHQITYDASFTMDLGVD